MDTGASLSIIGFSVLNENEIKNIKPERAQIKGITDHSLPVIGRIQLVNYLEKEKISFQVYVIDDRNIKFKTDGILSRNFLRQQRMSLCNLNSEVEFRNKRYKLTPLPDKEKVITDQIAQINDSNEDISFDVKTAEKITIPPMSATLVSVKCDRTLTGQYWFTPDRADIKNYRTAFATSFHEIKKSKVFQIYVINMSPGPKLLSKNIKLGTCKRINEKTPEIIADREIEIDNKEIQYEIFAFTGEDADLINGEGEEPLLEKAEHVEIDKILADTNLNENQKEKLANLLYEYSDVFYREGETLPVTTAGKANIETKEGQFAKRKQYPIPAHLKAELKEEIEKLLKVGVIKKCKPSEFNNPCIFLTRKVGNEIKKRLVIDMRMLNKLVKPIALEFPDMFDMITEAGSSDYLTSFDLCRAYNQVELEESAQKKTSFSVFGQSYCYTRLPFGLTTAPQIFTSIISNLFLDNLGEAVSCYLDDILIHTSGGFESHFDKVKEALKIVKKANFRLNAKKCKWFQQEIEYLGFKINKNSITPLDHKIKLIKDWPKPH